MAITRSQSRQGASLMRIQREIGRREAFRKKYKSTDVSKRHRLPDRQRKSVPVVSYTRRS